MSEKKRKTFYWLFKALSVLIACALPVWAIMERFPVWKTMYGKTHSIGVGGILVIIVLAIIFRNTVFNFIRDKLKITHAPPLAVWLVLIAISYVLVFIGQFLQDVVIVLWMGLIGCSAGTVLTFIAEHKFDDKKEEEHGQS
jgi:cadmium resistance protein CadD (predicted permease)